MVLDYSLDLELLFESVSNAERLYQVVSPIHRILVLASTRHTSSEVRPKSQATYDESCLSGIPIPCTAPTWKSHRRRTPNSQRLT
jgi:hypothetical protein